LNCFNILNIKYNLIINLKFQDRSIFIISELYLFDLNLNKFLTKKVAQNLNFFDNLVNVLYVATNFKRIIVKKDFK